MPYRRSVGKQCAVFGCPNNQKKRYDWQNSICGEHPGLLGKDCPCLVPFQLHGIPSKLEKRLEWLKSIDRKDLDTSPNTVVCSKHFLDGCPTKRNPTPVLDIGPKPTTPTKPSRRHFKRRLLEPKENLSLKKNSDQPSILIIKEEPIEDEIVKPTQDEMFLTSPVKKECILDFESEQCISLWCEKYPEHCQNKLQMGYSSTRATAIVALDHNYFTWKPREPLMSNNLVKAVQFPSSMEMYRLCLNPAVSTLRKPYHGKIILE